MQARQKMPLLRVWQYNEHGTVHIPTWVASCTEMHGDGLVLVRDSGKQAFHPGEWLVQEPGGDILWLTDIEFRDAYELT